MIRTYTIRQSNETLTVEADKVEFYNDFLLFLLDSQIVAVFHDWAAVTSKTKK